MIRALRAALAVAALLSAANPPSPVRASAAPRSLKIALIAKSSTNPVFLSAPSTKPSIAGWR